MQMNNKDNTFNSQLKLDFNDSVKKSISVLKLKDLESTKVSSIKKLSNSSKVIKLDSRKDIYNRILNRYK